jgi:hypothetical protein
MILFISGFLIGLYLGIISQYLFQVTNFNFNLFSKRLIAYIPCQHYHKKYGKIYAIKLYRYITNEGLKEAKYQIEKWFE